MLTGIRLLRSRFGLPLEGGPSFAALGALATAVAWGEGRLAALPALASCALLLALLHRGWRRQAAAEQLAARLANDNAIRPLSVTLERIAARMEGVEHRFADSHPTTGLPMREHLSDAMALDMNGSNPCQLGILRFTDFDRLFDFDQATADNVLAALAARLIAAARQDHFIAQIDRDCFAIWLRAAPDRDALLAEFRALAFVAEQEIELEDAVLRPTIETGVAAWPGDGDTPALLLARAMAALARAGAPDGSKSPLPPSESARERFIIERDLPRAIDADELALVFQPVVDLAAGRIVGAEALLRWTHPQLGQISPARFIPIVETIGLGDIYGLWVLNAAAREAKRWYDEGLRGLKMAVNLSARQLLDPALAVKIARTIERHRLDPAMIELELTETAAMADAAHTARVFAELRATGISLAIDDFGTGYSSLSYLKNLPFDKLKIDREFVTDIQHRRDSRAICRALVELGRGLDLSVLAEGVECEEELAALRDLGCHLFQGFHFAKPMPGEAFRALARDSGWRDSPVHHQLRHLEGRLTS